MREKCMIMVKWKKQILGTKHNDFLSHERTSMLANRKNFLGSHCKVHGHYTKRCWKLHLELCSKKGKEIMCIIQGKEKVEKRTLHNPKWPSKQDGARREPTSLGEAKFGYTYCKCFLSNFLNTSCYFLVRYFCKVNIIVTMFNKKMFFIDVCIGLL